MEMADEGFENIRGFIDPLPEDWNDAATDVIVESSSGRNSPLPSVSEDKRPTREVGRQLTQMSLLGWLKTGAPLVSHRGGEPIKYPVSGSADLKQPIPPISERDLKNKFRIQRSYKVDGGMKTRTIYFCAAGEHRCGVRIRRDQYKDGSSNFYSDGRGHSPHLRRTTHGLPDCQKWLVESMFNQQRSRVTVESIILEMERRGMQRPDYGQVKNYLGSLKPKRKALNRKARNPRHRYF